MATHLKTTFSHLHAANSNVSLWVFNSPILFNELCGQNVHFLQWSHQDPGRSAGILTGVTCSGANGEHNKAISAIKGDCVWAISKASICQREELAIGTSSEKIGGRTGRIGGVSK